MELDPQDQIPLYDTPKVFTAITAGAAPVQLVPYDSFRRVLIISCDGANIAYISTDQAMTTQTAIVLPQQTPVIEFSWDLHYTLVMAQWWCISFAGARVNAISLSKPRSPAMMEQQAKITRPATPREVQAYAGGSRLTGRGRPISPGARRILRECSPGILCEE